MSVATTTSKIQYTLTTGSQALSVPFYFLDNAHIKAVTVATETLPSITLVLGTDYTLTGAGNPSGGTLTTIATVGNGLTAGSKVVIKRNLPITQPTSYSPNDAFPAKVHEAALDRGVMLAQQIDEQADRALRFPEDDSTSATLPSTTDRANKAVSFDADGALVMTPLVGADGVLADESVGEDALQGAFRSRAQASVTAMKAQSYTNAKTGDRVELLGYYARGDGGGGLLYVDKADTTTADNGVMVFVASDGTRLKRALNGVLDFRMAGALADDSTDNTAKLVSAIALATANKLTLEIHGPGTYKVDGDGSISASNISIIGHGLPNLKQYNTDAYTFVIGNSVDNVFISGIRFTTDSSTGGSGDCIGFNVGDASPGCSNIVIEKCTFGPTANNIGVGGCRASKVRINDCVFNMGAQAQHGIYVWNVDDIVVNKCNIQGPGVGSPTFPGSVGIKFIGCNGAKAIGCTIKNWKDNGIQVQQQVGTDAPKNTIIDSCHISDMTVSGGTCVGISVADATTTKINNCTIENCNDFGIIVSSDDTQITNCLLLSTGLLSSGSFSGYAVNLAGENILLANNTIYGFTVFGVVITASASGVYKIDNNTIVGTTASRGITIAGGSTATGTISLNRISGCTTPIVTGGKVYYMTDGNLPAVVTTDTEGFIKIPNVNGTPTGAPSFPLGDTGLCFDPAANKLWIWSVNAVAWKFVALT